MADRSGNFLSRRAVCLASRTRVARRRIAIALHAVALFALCGFSVLFIGSDLAGDLLRGDLANPAARGAHPLLWFLVPTAGAVAIFLVRESLDGQGLKRVMFTRLQQQMARHYKGIYFALGAAVLLSAVALRVRTAAIVGGAPHLEPVLYSVSQVVAGKTLLSDLPAQYGLYAELLRPVFTLTGLSVLKFTLLLTTLQAVSSLMLATTAAALVQSKLLKSLLVLTFCWILGSTWMCGYASPLGYEYFQVWPIRFAFPAISVWLFVRARRRDFPTTMLVLAGALAGLGLVWNLDSGVPVAGALIASMLVRVIFASKDCWRRELKRLAIALVVPVSVASRLS